MDLENNQNGKVLEVKSLKTYFSLEEGVLKAVDDVSFSVGRKQILGLIGESGCGKSVTAKSILRLIRTPGRIVDGQILLHRDEDMVDIATLTDDGTKMRRIRGRSIAMIFQEPMSSLSPVHSIGDQIIEGIRLHTESDEDQARKRCLEMLARVGIPKPQERINYYPHQLSGGLRQRAMIAMALVCNPQLLIADEPTTALDVTVQAQILDLINTLQESMGMSVLYITHDLGVIASISSEVAVMYLGKIVERASTRTIFKNPLHPYTVRLLRSLPKNQRRSNTRLEAIKGTVPLPLNMKPQCGFCSRCEEARMGLCDRKSPELIEVEPDHYVRCFNFTNKEAAHE